MNPRSTILGVCLAAAVSTNAFAQRLMVPHSSPSGLVALIDANAGALIDAAWIDVQSTGIPTPSATSLRDVERVGDEVWVTGADWVYRYSATTRDYIGSFQESGVIRSIEAQLDPSFGERVLVTMADEISIRDIFGGSLGTFAIVGAGDTMDRGDGTMLVANKDESRVDIYTLAGTYLTTFAGPIIPSALGVLSRPQQLARRAGNGNVLVAGDVRVYEFDEFGGFICEIDVGPFESGISDTRTDYLFVTLASGVALHDLSTGATTIVGGPFFGQGRKVGFFDRGVGAEIEPGQASTQTICRGTIGESYTSAALCVLGSTDVDDRFVALQVERVPADAPVMMALSREPGSMIVGGSQLCLHRRALALLPGALPATSGGRAYFSVMRGSEQSASLTAGLTFYAQALYWVAGELRLSDAVRVTMAQ